jgi:hypothetical protein
VLAADEEAPAAAAGRPPAAVAGRALRLLHHVQHPRAHLQAPRLRGACVAQLDLALLPIRTETTPLDLVTKSAAVSLLGVLGNASHLFLVAIVWGEGHRIAGRASSGPTGSAATTRSSTDSSPTAPPSSASRWGEWNGYSTSPMYMYEKKLNLH